MEKIYILPFDHRNYFRKFLAGEAEEASPEGIKESKRIIYEGFRLAVASGVAVNDCAILVDEEYGTDVLKSAVKEGIRRIIPVEKSGEDEFHFEYKEAFPEHIEKFQPDFVKALLRYNPEGDKEANSRSRGRLKDLAEFCSEEGHPFLLELLVPPLDKEDTAFDGSPRASLTGVAVRELARDGILPDIWKLEGFDEENDLARVLENVREETPEAKVVILGRGENGEHVARWLSVGAKFREVVGFAVGRTIFASPLKEWKEGRADAAAASALIGKNFQKFVSVFESAKSPVS
ncbi:MAG: DUF2090 domain-containing protein [Patescibacteria group bacterium]